jgi:hypothetical protein
MEDIFANFGYNVPGGDGDLIGSCGYMSAAPVDLAGGWTNVAEGPGGIEDIMSDWWNVLHGDLQTFGLK